MDGWLIAGVISVLFLVQQLVGLVLVRALLRELREERRASLARAGVVLDLPERTEWRPEAAYEQEKAREARLRWNVDVQDPHADVEVD